MGIMYLAGREVILFVYLGPTLKMLDGDKITVWDHNRDLSQKYNSGRPTS
jgi:hypothetical protein